jgi:hypothetical protein
VGVDGQAVIRNPRVEDAGWNDAGEKDWERGFESSFVNSYRRTIGVLLHGQTNTSLTGKGVSRRTRISPSEKSYPRGLLDPVHRLDSFSPSFHEELYHRLQDLNMRCTLVSEPSSHKIASGHIFSLKT